MSIPFSKKYDIIILGGEMKIKDGIKIYFGKVIGKLIILAIGITLAILIPVFILS